MSTRAKTPWNRTAALAGLALSTLMLSGCGVAMPTAPSMSHDASILAAPHGTPTSQSASKISIGDEGSNGGTDTPDGGSGTIQSNPNDTLPNSTPLGAPQAPGNGPGPKHGHHGHHHRRGH